MCACVLLLLETHPAIFEPVDEGNDPPTEYRSPLSPPERRVWLAFSFSPLLLGVIGLWEAPGTGNLFATAGLCSPGDQDSGNSLLIGQSEVGGAGGVRTIICLS